MALAADLAEDDGKADGAGAGGGVIGWMMTVLVAAFAGTTALGAGEGGVTMGLAAGFCCVAAFAAALFAPPALTVGFAEGSGFLGAAGLGAAGLDTAGLDATAGFLASDLLGGLTIDATTDLIRERAEESFDESCDLGSGFFVGAGFALAVPFTAKGAPDLVTGLLAALDGDLAVLFLAVSLGIIFLGENTVATT